MIRWFLRSIADPRVERYLLASEGERIEDEVRHHWVVYVFPAVEVLLALALMVGFLFTDMRVALAVALLATALAGHGGWRALTSYKDRFVVTNMRVFRVSGVATQRRATMPISRILDITVETTMTGRLLHYGHLMFESAAREQGVRDIRYVGDPDARDLTIQRVIQRSGLRSARRLH
ncbi:MAG TPA: PH domain-containing protein [Nocardioidaceae bacterium]|nr:PH domain-containing protein [Nocardioidaceae bacterium]